jgi:hypothetical protein
MKEQKVIITKSEKDINDWLERGWRVTSVTAQYVSTSTANNGTASYSSQEKEGKFCFVIEKN